MRVASAVVLACLATSGCTTYQYAKNVKLVSFDNNITEGRGVGPVRGESCQQFILGFPINEPPSLDKAFVDTQSEVGRLRYMNNVATEGSGFDAIVYAQRCIIVKATGFK